MDIGNKVKLKEDYTLFNKVYKKDHVFTIKDMSYRGWDLEDTEGNKIDEALFIHDKFELICECSSLTEEHDCPFELEINDNDDPKFCKCCDYCMDDCRDRI